ncbi:MAG: hypothetical protein IKY83_00510 [Proteobacteria bacterium]|nr:hypothetical protein [Pseudomonadota bacterium]
MMSIDERNAYISEHLVELKRIRDGYARTLHRRFSAAPMCDLQGYGWLGVIYGLDRVDPGSPTFDAFIQRYIYLFTLTGCMEMLGIHRDRSSRPVEVPTFESYDPHELVEVVDGVQNIDFSDYGDYEEILDRQEVEHLLEVVEGTDEAEVLMGLLRHQSLSEIAQQLDMTRKKVRKCIATLIRLSKRESAFMRYMPARKYGKAVRRSVRSC